MSFVIPTTKLSSGQELGVIGLGTYDEKDPKVLKTAIKSAINSGYRHIDCAHLYGNEEIIGEALKEAIAESEGKLKREDLFIVSKCWCTHMSKAKCAELLDVILKNLQLEYLDLYLIHWPNGFKEGTNEDFPTEDGKLIPSDIHYTETYQAMEELMAQGKTKSIGLSNFNIAQVKDILAICKIKPVCNQFEAHPYFSNEELVKYCQSENIVSVAYGPLGGPARPWRTEVDPVLLQDETILSLAKKYNKTPAQIILRWLLKRNIVVIPKSVTPSRIAENGQALSFELSDEDFTLIQGLNRNLRFYAFTVAKEHKFYPFKE